MINKIVILFCFIFSAGLNTYSQSGSSSIDQVAGKFMKMVQAVSKEKISVYTDKWFYEAGEDIWFKAFCLNALSNRLTQKSKNLFVDLVNDKDSVFSQALFNITLGKTGGKLSLSASMREGYYWIRAYTSNILRDDSNRIFVKPLYILNKRRSNSRSLSINTSESNDNLRDSSMPEFLFFPEGGSLVSGTTATVGFRCITVSGKPLNASGYITDSRDSTVAYFKTILPGIGKFSFDAWNPRKYFAHVKWANNREFIVPLPLINQFASQLTLVDQTDRVFHVRISQGDSLYKKNKTTFILGLSRDSLCFAANGTDMYEVNIPKNIFPKGKATLFLFDDQGQIVSQRSLYIDSSLTRMVLQPDKTAYGPREKAKVDISISGFENHPVNALFSVSVTDDRFAKQAFEQNQTPGFYSDDLELPESGSSNSPEQDKKYSQEEMDMIMLTQKDLYPSWKYADEIRSISPSTSIEEDYHLGIGGRIVNKTNAPLSGYLVNLFSDQKGMFNVDTTDARGHFFFKLPDFEEGSKFTLKLTNPEGISQEGKVILDKIAFPLIVTPHQLKYKLSATDLSVIRNFKSHLLDTLSLGSTNGSLTPVTVNSAKGTLVSYDESKRMSRFSYIITPDKFENGDNFVLVNAIKAIPGFNTGIQSMKSPSATDLSNGTTEGDQPLVVMDGVRQSLSSGDVNTFLMSLDPTTIDFIEILKGAQTAIFGMEGSGGVILINTTNNRKGVTEINQKGITTIYPNGYFNEISFPAPDYDKKESKKSSFPDLRSTIYWNANVRTDKNGKASIEFFTADDASTYTISLLGITDAGEFIYKQGKIIRK